MKRVAGHFALLASVLLLTHPLFSVCTATASNKGGGTDNGSAGTATVSATIAAVGDGVIIPVWCFQGCTISSVTLGSQAATQTTVAGSSDANEGQPNIYYITSAAASGVQTITATVTGTHTDVQVGYIDFTPSAGCTFAHDVDSAKGTGSGATANAPSITATAGDVEYVFTAIACSISSVNAPWTQGTIYATSANADGYILSASGSATANNMSTGTCPWQALATSFSMSSGGGGGTPAPPQLQTMGVGD